MDDISADESKIRFCPYCGKELEKHEVEHKIDDCGLTKVWYQDGYYCRSCDDVLE